MGLSVENLFPSKTEKEQARPTTTEKRYLKQKRDLRCAVTDQRFDWGERYRLHLHHKHEVQYGGTNDPKNLVLIRDDVHEKIHHVARSRGKNLYQTSKKFQKMRRKEGRRLALAESCVDTTNHAIEMTRLAMVADLGYDLRYVYGNEYAEDKKTKQRIDQTIGKYEG